MSIDELHHEKLKECNMAVNCIDTDDTEDENDYCQKENDTYIDPHMQNLENLSGFQRKPTIPEAKEHGRRCSVPASSELESRSEKNEVKDCEMYNGKPNILASGNEVCDAGLLNISFQRKPPKLVFCPKEVKGIIESEALLQRNAQSHTMRKIIVFACLGIRHGCEEIYELDLNHFSIVRKGDPYISPQNPAEHVLYENPGVKRKIFYPNRQNQMLCPVQILEEEKAMRTLEADCPSCLFLCIKYGGRTRNVPQNEYVRQRMGRNKLKSFGPLICRMAMLANVRSGSFFFKALGITLLFMAGFPDEVVRNETKYCNFDLLQKYYRTDKDAEGAELFRAYSTTDNIEDRSVSEQLAERSNSAKSKGKRQSSTNKSSIQQSSSSIQTRATAAFQSLASPSQRPVDHNHPIPNPVVASSSAVASYQNQNPFNYFPPNAFVPIMIYWPPPNPGLYPSAYNYHGNYIPFQSQPHCSYPCSPFIPQPVERSAKNEDTSEETDSDSDINSSSKDQNIPTSCQQKPLSLVFS